MMGGRARGAIAPMRAGATAGAAPQLNVDRLRAVVDQLDEMKRDFRGFRDRAEECEKRSRDREKVLYAENKLLKAELGAITARVRYLEDLQGIEQADEEPVASGGAEAEGEGEAAGDTGMGSGRVQREVGPSAEEIVVSTHYAASNEIKEVVAVGFALLMDLPRIDGKNLPAYPKPHDEWPTHGMTGDPCVRFDWSKTDKEKVNTEGIEKVLQWVLASGATEVKQAAEGLSKILVSDLRKRCCTKFAYMRGEFRKLRKGGNKRRGEETSGDAQEEELGAGGRGGDGEGGDGEGGDRIGGQQVDQDEQEDATRRSFLRVRAEKTAEQRKRKAKGTEWEDARYAAAFLPNAISDNEDMPVEPGKAKSYIARAPWYRSQALQDIYDALDELPDPQPDKAKVMVSRVRGPVKQGIEPPKARRLDTRLRVWQMDAEALATNTHWLTSGRVAPSGKAWGDAEDPVDDAPASAKGKNRGGPPKIRRREGAADVTQARAHFKASTSGLDIEGLFAN